MAVYYTIKCPHCKKVVESGKNRTSQYGTPLKICSRCGKHYVDDNFVEAGCLDDAELKRRAFSWQSIIWLLFGVTIAIFGISELAVFFIVLGIAVAVVGLTSIVSFILYVPSKDKSLQEELLRSKRRLSNPNYVIALMETGCYVNTELVEWAKRETGYKDKKDIIKERVMSNDNYDKSRYLCKSYKYLSNAGVGKCMLCFHISELKKFRIKNDMGTREIPICDKCVNRLKEHNPNI